MSGTLSAASPRLATGQTSMAAPFWACCVNVANDLGDIGTPDNAGIGHTIADGAQPPTTTPHPPTSLMANNNTPDPQPLVFEHVDSHWYKVRWQQAPFRHDLRLESRELDVWTLGPGGSHSSRVSFRDSETQGLLGSLSWVFQVDLGEGDHFESLLVSLETRTTLSPTDGRPTHEARSGTMKQVVYMATPNGIANQPQLQLQLDGVIVRSGAFRWRPNIPVNSGQRRLVQCAVAAIVVIWPTPGRQVQPKCRAHAARNWRPSADELAARLFEPNPRPTLGRAQVGLRVVIRTFEGPQPGLELGLRDICAGHQFLFRKWFFATRTNPNSDCQDVCNGCDESRDPAQEFGREGTGVSGGLTQGATTDSQVYIRRNRGSA
ncbi:hypothetical protein C8R46DRAFT_1042374 [Mycena filopes]|nr:hypothetical protein C8R46DRAFT_1042374 [Mycena filopes]